MATVRASKLKRLYLELPPGTPITTSDLAAYEISPDLAVHYVRSGWLTRLARGVYYRAGDELLRDPSLRVLEKKIDGLHVGGKSALDWHGLRQYISQESLLYLYGSADATLPPWFVKAFPSEYHRKRIFRENRDQLLDVSPFENRLNAPLVSAPERALLELLSEVGVRQSMQEAREIMEGTYNMRASVLERLLIRCTSVKTVRLCVNVGHELNLKWAAKLDKERLPTGSSRPWVSISKNGSLVLKP